MPPAQPNRIICPGCGRSGPYRPELAGKKLKCKCGQVIHIPAAAAAAASAEQEPLRPQPLHVPKPADVEDEYDVRQPEPPSNRDVERPADVVAYQSAPPQSAPKDENAPTMYQAYARPKTYQADPGADQTNVIRIALILAIAVVIIGGSIFGIKMLGGKTTSTTANLPGEDADIESQMQDGYCKEIHAWYQEDSTRIMGPWSQSQALSQADHWTQMGAKQVLALGPRMSLVAIIELPDDPAKRKQLFDWQAQWHLQHFEKVWTDVGQKYLMIRLGI
jgi:hypothetical protein